MAFTDAAPSRTWSALGQLGASVAHVLARARWSRAAAMLVAALFGKAMWASIGAGPALTWVVLGSAAVAIIAFRRAFPQTVGVIAASLGSATIVTAGALVSIGAVGAPVVPFALILVAVMLVIVTAAVFVAPHRGIHVGWSIALAQGTILCTVPAAVCWPDNGWTGVILFTAFIAALGGVYFRSRHALRMTGRWRCAARVVGLVLVSASAAVTLALGAPGPAAGFLGIGDLLESKANSMICSFTRPDLTAEGVGTGPESMFPARNFGQVKGIGKNASSIPANSDQIGNFDRLGPNFAMDNYTLFEISGLRGLKYVNWQKNDAGEEVCSIMPWLSVTSGNMTMSLNTYILQGAIWLKEVSQSGRPFNFLYDKTIPMVDALFNYLFLPAAAIMVVIAGIGLVLRSMRSGRGFRESLGETGGTLAILMLGGMLFGGLSGASWTNPGTSGFFIVGSTIDSAAAWTNSEIAEISFKALDLGGDNSMCKSPQAVPAAPGQDEAYAAAAPGQRFSSCILAEGLAYRPWAIGQFGGAGNNVVPGAEAVTRYGDPRVGGNPSLVTAKSDAKGQGVPCYNNYLGCKDLRTYLIAQAGGPSFEASRKKCMDSAGDYTRLIQCDPYHAVANQLHLREKSGNQAESNDAAAIARAYSGQGRFPHLTQSLVALIATVITSAGIGVVSVISLYWQFMLLILFVTGVARLLFAAFPGKASAGGDYLKDFASTFIMRVGYGLLSLVMIAGVSLIFGAKMAMGVKILFVALLMFGLIRSTKKLAEKLKVQGSTMDGPTSGINRTLGAGTALAGYSAYKGAGAVVGGGAKLGGAAVKGGSRAAKWSVTRPSPAPGGGPGGGPGGPDGGGRWRGGGAPGSSPVARASAASAGAAAAAGGAAARAGRGIGRGARTLAHPMAPWAGDKLDAAGQGLKRGGRRVDRALGQAIAPARKAGGQASMTASKLAGKAGSRVRDAAERVKREGAAAMSYATPNAYAGVMPESYKKQADQARSDTSTWAGRRNRTSFADAERKDMERTFRYAARARARRR